MQQVNQNHQDLSEQENQQDVIGKLTVEWLIEMEIVVNRYRNKNKETESLLHAGKGKDLFKKMA